MNKVKLFVAALLVVAGFSASAQKSGYISLDQVVYLMPEVRKIDSSLQRFQADSLNPQYAYMISEYNRKDSLANGKDSLKTPATVRAQMRQELEGLAYQIQNWQGIVQNEMQAKQNELLQPIYAKVMNALNTVAKESGYSYVYNMEALLVAPPADNLLPLVAKKLNLKLPAGATNATPAAATNPPKKQ
jgi:outer membrane protein